MAMRLLDTIEHQKRLQRHIMKTQKEIKEKIKKTKANITEQKGLTIMQYWLGYLRALEWVGANDKNKTSG
jgi:cyclopropane fatty-acyl-phospholipid synthase-like methyltransferase